MEPKRLKPKMIPDFPLNFLFAMPYSMCVGQRELRRKEMTTQKLTTATRNAIKNYGVESCIRAYDLCDKQGEGGYTVAARLGLKNSRQAESATQAGRELVTGSRF